MSLVDLLNAAGVPFDRWVLFTLAEIALSLSPGPAVLLVVSLGVARGLRASAAAALGVLSANALYFALSAFGLGALIAVNPLWFDAVRWFGVAYLAWLGVSALAARGSPFSISAHRSKERSAIDVYFSGLTLQLANPKTLLFFVAILPGFVDRERALALQMAIFAASSIGPEWLILLGYGWLASRARAWLGDGRVGVWIDRIAGVFLLVIATIVAVGASKLG